MSRTDSKRSRGPMLGALLRIAHSQMVEEYSRWLATTSYHDIQPAHAAVIQPLWQQPDGPRLPAFAQVPRITKQSMGALVDSLEQGGYVERVEDPDDRRASRVRLTARGRSFARDVRAFASDLESRLADRIGKRRLEDLRTGLDLLVNSPQD